MKRIAWMILLLPGCVLGELDSEGLSCPCGPGAVCDTTRNVCVSELPAESPDAGKIEVNDPPPVIVQPRERPSEIFLRSLAPSVVAMQVVESPDAGINPDAATATDAAAPDAEVSDVGLPADPDAGEPDTGPVDAGFECFVDADCATGDVCNPNTQTCQTGLTIGQDCTEAWQCSASLCLSTNFTGGAQSFCSELCGASADCPLTTSCLDIDELKVCVRREAFNPQPDFTTPTGGTCTDGNACHGAVCNSGASSCMERCSNNADCASQGGNCWLYAITDAPQICHQPGALAAPGASCTANNQCLSGICDIANSRCAAPCCTHADCGGAEHCEVMQFGAVDLVKVCRPNGTGTVVLGGSCTQDSDCVGGLCIPEDADLPTGPRVCSTPCCRPSDCAIMPQSATCSSTTGPVAQSLVARCELE